MKKLLLVVSSVFFALAVRGNTIVFNTLGPGGTYNANGGYTVGAGGTEEAAAFTAGASGFLATVDLGINYVQGPEAVSVFLYGNANGSPDNSNQIFLGSGTSTTIFGSSNSNLLTIAVSANAFVTMGSTYWLVLKPTGPGWNEWNNSSPSVLGSVDIGFGGPWSPYGSPSALPAFRITAFSAVADSGNTLFLLLGSAATLIVLKQMVPERRTVR